MFLNNFDKTLLRLCASNSDFGFASSWADMLDISAHDPWSTIQNENCRPMAPFGWRTSRILVLYSVRDVWTARELPHLFRNHLL